jgi:hypothetical protein
MATLKENMEAIKLEKDTKILPENLKAGITAFGVEGTIEIGKVPVKLFETKDAMLNDMDAEIDDKALVYRQSLLPAYEGLEVNSVYIHPSVTLTEAVTAQFLIGMRDADNVSTIYITLNPTTAYVSIRDNTSGVYASIDYTSVDGKTFTTTNTEYVNKLIKVSKNVQFVNFRNTWHEAIGKFVSYMECDFDGIYEYIDKKDEEYFDVLTGVTVDTTNSTVSSLNTRIHEPRLFNAINAVVNEIAPYYYIVVKCENDYYLQVINSVQQKHIDLDNNNKVYHGSLSSSTPTAAVYKLNLDDATYTFVENVASDFSYGSKLAISPYHDGNVVFDSSIEKNYTQTIYAVSGGASVGTYTGSIQAGISTFIGWHRLPTDLTVDSAYKLLPGEIAFGKYGEVVGTNAIYDKLNYVDLLLSKKDAIDVVTSAKTIEDGYGIIKSDSVTMENLLQPSFLTHISKHDVVPSASWVCDGYYLHKPESGSDTFDIYDFNGNKIVEIPSEGTSASKCAIANLSDTELVYAFGYYHTDSGEKRVVSGVIDIENKTFTKKTLLLGSSTSRTFYIRSLCCANGHYYMDVAAVTYSVSDVHNARLVVDGEKEVVGPTITAAVYPTSFQYGATDGTYMYGFGYGTSSSGSADGYRIEVWNITNDTYVGELKDTVNGGIMATCNDSNKVYLMTNSTVYELNGLTKKATQFVAPTTSLTDSAAIGYVVTMNDNSAMYVGSRVINLLTGELFTIPGSSNAPSNYTYTSSYKGTKLYTTGGYISAYTIRPDFVFEKTDNVVLQTTDSVIKSGYKHFMPVTYKFE